MRTKPVLMDRLKPFVRALGYATPLQRELRKRFRSAPPCRAIQIGAHDGVTHDPFREYLIQPGWESIVLEPNPAIFPTLAANYRAYPNVVPRNLAASYTADRLSLWVLAEEFLSKRSDSSVLSTLVSHSRETMEEHLRMVDGASASLREIVVPCVTVEALLEEQGWPRIDALFVDVEGFENDILLNMDCARLDARYIVFEHHLLADQGAAIVEKLTGFGYVCIRIASDTLAVKSG